MGLFFSSPEDKYSSKEIFIAEKTIRDMVSRSKVRTMDGKEEKLVEDALIKRRGSDTTMSMRQVYRVLRDLKESNKISKFDLQGLVGIFEEYFVSQQPADQKKAA